MTAISIYIYKFPLGDATAGGASTKYEELYLFSEDSKTEEIANYADMKGIDYEQCFKVATIHHYGEYKRAIPAFRLCQGMVGPMAGGNYGYTCDSRYREVTNGLKYPISIHDRYETHEDYLLHD